jgi:hypothetical protein
MAYKTRNGRRIQMPRTATNGIQYLVKLEGTVATFECKEAGHQNTHDYGKGPRARQMDAKALRHFAPYWGLGLNTNGTRGHCYGWCQKCQNELDGAR